MELASFLSDIGLLAARRPYIANCRILTFEGPKTILLFHKFVCDIAAHNSDPCVVHNQLFEHPLQTTWNTAWHQQMKPGGLRILPLLACPVDSPTTRIHFLGFGTLFVKEDVGDSQSMYYRYLGELSHG